jgi:hypothetical protein
MNSKDAALIELLESSWDIDSGFFGLLRCGQYSEDSYKELLTILKQVPVDQDTMPKRVVSLLWYMPMFLEWHREFLVTKAAIFSINDYDFLCTEILNAVQDILGIP